MSCKKFTEKAFGTKVERSLMLDGITSFDVSNCGNKTNGVFSITIFVLDATSGLATECVRREPSINFRIDLRFLFRNFELLQESAVFRSEAGISFKSLITISPTFSWPNITARLCFQLILDTISSIAGKKNESIFRRTQPFSIDSQRSCVER
jgi:hypothetical protein